ncbi:hypothetical protein [Saccharopolyspora gregorii]|uniref:hypothetical protein n=1 Tax=Saccharopolyspora gregorii TaxID=33914 RepID=UPI0021ACFF9C|nr:hypothetical protein [Saccharopolyspora gregorii]
MASRKQVDPHLARPSTPEPVRSVLPIDSQRHLGVEVRPSGYMPPARVMHLQRTLGNMTVARTLQDHDATPASLQAEGIDTMGALLDRFKMPISKYRIPDDARAAVPEDEEKIAEFNKRLDQLAEKAPFNGSFTVAVETRDLPGSGDYMAAAKFARALAEFYSFIEEWKDVTVRLSVGRLDGDAPETHKDSVRREVRGVLGESGASLYEGNGERADVTIGYPVGGGVDQDFTVAQYGFNQFGSPEFNEFGSGPGFGSLGVLPVPDRDRQDAITAAENAKKPREDGVPPTTVMAALNDLEVKHDLAGFHFAYYSTFDRPVKPFVTEIVDSIDNRPESAGPIEKPNVGIAVSKPAKGLESAAAAVRAKPGWQVVHYSISRNESTIETKSVNPPARAGAQGGGKKVSNKERKRAKSKGAPATATTGGEAAASSAAAGVEHVLVLVEFPEGVRSNEMLSLYYSSLDPAGATGDQSFIEAYQMMAPNTHIRYDVAEHQRKLARHIEELNAYDEGTGRSVMTKNKEAQRGVRSVPVDPGRKLVQKNLLHPMLLLINEKLQRQQQRDA